MSSGENRGILSHSAGRKNDKGMIFFQMLKMKLLDSATSRFKGRYLPGMTVLPLTGEVVVRGKETEEAPFAVHVFGLVGSGEKKLQKLREVKASCQHSPGLSVVGVEGRMLLAVTCEACRRVTLIDLKTGDASTAYQGGLKADDFRYCDQRVGELGKLWLLQVQVIGGDTNNLRWNVIELDCSRATFTPTGRGFLIDLKRCSSFCYLPAPHNALVFSDGKSKVLLSVDCESGEKLWELKGKVDGAKIDPIGVTFSPQHQLILMADEDNRRILVVDPSSGSHLQSLPVPQEVGNPFHLCLHNERLFMISHIRSKNSNMLSCFSLT